MHEQSSNGVLTARDQDSLSLLDRFRDYSLSEKAVERSVERTVQMRQASEDSYCDCELALQMLLTGWFDPCNL
jgi:hypothetical protein